MKTYEKISDIISIAAIAILAFGPLFGLFEWWTILIALFAGGNKLSYRMAHSKEGRSPTRLEGPR